VQDGVPHEHVPSLVVRVICRFPEIVRAVRVGLLVGDNPLMPGTPLHVTFELPTVARSAAAGRRLVAGGKRVWFELGGLAASGPQPRP
jgi:hypothetical protein